MTDWMDEWMSGRVVYWRNSGVVDVMNRSVGLPTTEENRKRLNDIKIRILILEDTSKTYYHILLQKKSPPLAHHPHPHTHAHMSNLSPSLSLFLSLSLTGASEISDVYGDI